MTFATYDPDGVVIWPTALDGKSDLLPESECSLQCLRETGDGAESPVPQHRRLHFFRDRESPSY